MLKLNKKTEYALLALKHLSARQQDAEPATQEDGGLVPASVREVAHHYGIPEMLLAKVLQTLKKGGIVRSVKGAAGGYALTRGLVDVRVTEVFDLFNEPMALVECVDDHEACRQAIACDIQAPMRALNTAIHRLLAGMSLAELFDVDGPAAAVAPVTQLSIYRAGDR